ncbi:D-alanyl-D-alanine carboxypeptidase [Algibacter sp. L4_22]|uniref:D-alanyl-D-alanine carboxypeptidase n=1 Tax=Algibacter sp. L4_22 TaxID=2942477 RepID=UPI00201B7377|nr:D-alanyl-D-alanine carboxypeptidase [Algibacter sp. L4_22]MCL5127640.1 D-alanyl-D-alanine carboxypeptidase [Algibacter sp. L4_22]
MSPINKYFIFISILIMGSSCKSARITKQINRDLETNFYNNQFTGFLVYNPKMKDTIYQHNAQKYFTPASNTKIFTLYTALQMLPDSIPALKYNVKNDTLTIVGTGNPTFLHTYFKDSTALNLTKKYKIVNIIENNLADEKFGPGWAWEDYDTYFNPERSAFPVYGNVVTISNLDSLICTPSIFKKNISDTISKHKRSYNENIFYYNPKHTDSVEIPLVLNRFTSEEIWKDLLPTVNFTTKIPSHLETVYSIPSDTLYKRMMHVSDNFLAEQMLIMASSTLSDTLSSKNAREFILENHLKTLTEKPRWVDGSGLSRYNLFSPKSFVDVLSKLYDSIPKARLFNLFPAGGTSGTLKKWYAGTNQPYIYAKSGTLGNNYSLSGYLITNTGETLIFSFMNNHYTKPTTEVKQNMQTIFEYLRNTY